MNNYQQYRPGGFSGMPPVTKNILIINVILFFATFVLGNQGVDLTDMLGLHYFSSEKFKIYQIITYMFMHGGLAHIFFNMFAVWMFGTAVEGALGSRKFLIYYLLTGIGAAAVHYGIVYFELNPIVQQINAFISQPTETGLQDLLNSDSFKTFQSQEMLDAYRQMITHIQSGVQTFNDEQVLRNAASDMTLVKEAILNAPIVVGASGSVFGLLLAYGMLWPNNVIYIYFAIPMKAKYFVILYGLIELFSGVANVPGDNVAHFAHLGGLITGIILLLIWRKKTGNFFKPYEY